MTALLAAACAGLAAWLSIGALAVTDSGGQITRIGLLPPIWLLPVLIGVCIATAWITSLKRETSLPLFCSLLLVLPWIPGRVPAAFLVWTGRVAVGLWAAIAVALLAVSRRRHFGPGGAPAWTKDPRRAPRIAAAVACALYIGSAWWLAGILPGGDEPHYLIITQSLLKDHDLRIENNHTRRDYAEYFRGDLKPDFLRRGTNGQIYSIHAPGLSVAIAPAYALLGYHGVVVFLSIVAAIGGAMMWRSVFQLSGNPGAAWFSWASWALTVPFYFQAFSVFPDGLGATVVLFAALPLLEEGVQRVFWTGAALALLPWLHTRFAIIAVALGFCFVLRLMWFAEGRSRLPAFLAMPVLSAVAWFSFFRAIYGTFNPAAPYSGYTQSAFSNILTGLPALFFDQQFGILPYAPVYAMGLVGMAALARQRPRLALELSSTLLAYLFSSSAYHMWWGGSSPPARFAVPVLPLLVVPAGWLWNSARHRVTRMIAIVMLFVSIGITLLVVFVDSGQLAYNVRDGYSRFAEWLSPLVDLPGALPSFFRQTSGEAMASGLIWVASILLAWFVLKSEIVKRWLDARSALYLAGLVSLAVAAMLATTIVWHVREASGTTADTSERSLLEHVDPRIRPVGVEPAGMTFGSTDHVISRISISTPQRRTDRPASTLLVVPGVLPAGTYALLAPDRAQVSGTAKLVIGRNARPLVVWNLRTDLRDGAVRFDLPVNVGSIVVQGDDEAAREVKSLALKAIEVRAPATRPTSDYARRAERYGPAVAYFFDDGAFVEDPGFWVRGGLDATIAVTPAEPGTPLQLFVRNAPVINRVEIDVDGHPQMIALQPREERLLPLPIPIGRGAALINIHSNAGFRPSEVEAGSTDNRYLGVWIELRQR